jgi:hypothetical protein
MGQSSEVVIIPPQTGSHLYYTIHAEGVHDSRRLRLPGIDQRAESKENGVKTSPALTAVKSE